jgi:hypothetical protein
MPKNFLPKEFRESHRFCFFLHDQLLETLSSATKANIFNIVIKFKSERDAKKVEDLRGGQFIDWLQKNGYEKEVYDLYYRQIISGLLKDFLHFVYEALQASKKGKLTVAYALLRKPFKDNLFYLEWLLAYPEDFLKRFDTPGGPKLSFPVDQTKTRQIEIITTAYEKIEGTKLLSGEIMHRLRYDKREFDGLEFLWQQANHLITTMKPIQTRQANFNFVFSDRKAKHLQWKQMYALLPLFLFHTIQVVEALMVKIAKRKDVENDTVPLRTLIGLNLWFETHPWLKDKQLPIFAELPISIENAKCVECEEKFKLGRRELKSIYLRNSVKCYKCGTKNIL